MSMDFRDNSPQVKARIRANVEKALTAMGLVGVEAILDQMNTGYDKPIYLTGDLQRSINFETDAGEQATAWGTNLEYGPAVHEGNGRMGGRAFLRDGITKNKDALRDTAAQHLKNGF